MTKKKPSPEDIANLISDFTKGKAGPRGADMAQIDFSGLPSLAPSDFPEDARPGWPNTQTIDSMVSQYPGIVKSIQGFALGETVMAIGGMLTLPELQSNCVRLEVLVNMVVMHAKGDAVPKATRIANWFTALDSGVCGRLEDPAEDVFIELVHNGQDNFRLFGGVAEANAADVQICLDVLNYMPTEDWCADLKKSVYAILKLSDAVAQKCELERYELGNSRPEAGLQKVSAEIFASVKERVCFKDNELANLGIDISALEPFLFKLNERDDVGKGAFGQSILERSPLYREHNRLIVMLPNLIGISVRRHIIETCIAKDRRKAFEEAFTTAYANMFQAELLFGQLRNLPIKFQRAGDVIGANMLTEVDVGRYLHLVFFCDSLDAYEKTGFADLRPSKDIEQFIEVQIAGSRKEFRALPDFKEAISVVISCGWGRPFSMKLPKSEEDWQITSIPAHDVRTLSWIPGFRVLDLFRVLDADEAAAREEINVFNVNGFLNLYGHMDGNRGHIIPHERLDRNFYGEMGQPVFFNIPLNSMLKVREKAYKDTDLHVVKDPQGKAILVRRLDPSEDSEDLVPFYADLDAMKKRVMRCVYELDATHNIWASAQVEPTLDGETMYNLGKMVMHWAQVVSEMLAKIEKPSAKSFEWRVCFEDDAIPDHRNEQPQLDEIPKLVEFTVGSEQKTVEVLVRRGFLLAAKIPQNIAECTFAKALALSGIPIIKPEATQLEIDSVITQITTNTSARHFHVFETNDPRDYVRENLPNRVIEISRIDDATSRLGLGWRVRDRSEGDTIEGVDASVEYLSKAVSAIGEQLLRFLSQFNRAAVVEMALLNHEGALAESQQWTRTFRAITAVSKSREEAYDKAKNKIGKMNASMLASRIVAEMAICSSPISDGLIPGERDFGIALSMAMQLFHYGGYYDSMKAGVMEPMIRISPAGDIMTKQDFIDDTLIPLGEAYNENSLDAAAANYEKNYPKQDDQKEVASDRSELSVEFKKAWEEEYGFSIESLREVINYFSDYTKATRQPIMSLRRAELIDSIAKDTGEQSTTVEAILNLFVLKPRNKWAEAPPGFLKNAWQPWRFRRQLSIVSRPIVQIDEDNDPAYTLSPPMTVQHMIKLVGDTYTARLNEAFFKSGGKLAKWIRATRNERGNAFNESVAKKFRDAGWKAEANLSDGKLLSRPKEDAFGDVDVFAWDPQTGRVLVVECKDLAIDRTFGEIARRLAKYRGLGTGRNRDELRRHLDRFKELKKNTTQLSKFIDGTINSIEPLLVFSESAPMQFDKTIKNLGVTALTIGAIGKL